MREALARLLEFENLHVIGQAGTANAGYDLVLRRRPAVTVLDIRLANESGLDLTRRLLENLPDLAVLLYTGELIEAAMVTAIMQTGARGLALKSGDADQLIKAIRSVAAGEKYIDPALRAARPQKPRPADGLSEREREIIRLVGAGLTNERIAETLFLSPHTVRTHVRNSLRKLGVRTRAEAVLALERTEPPIPGLFG